MPRVSADLSLRSRELLDSHFDEWQRLRGLARPPRGWLHAIRTALGMSTAALGSRLGITAGAVTRLEQSEAADRVQLGTLRRAADAVGCDLVYLLVPRRPLSATVDARALELATAQVAAMQQTMRLEDQAARDTADLTQDLVRRLVRRGGLWDAADD